MPQIDQTRTRAAYTHALTAVLGSKTIKEFVSNLSILFDTPETAVYRAVEFDSKTGEPTVCAWKVDRRSTKREVTFMLLNAGLWENNFRRPADAPVSAKFRRSIEWGQFESLSGHIKDELISHMRHACYDGSYTLLTGDNGEGVFLLSAARCTGSSHTDPSTFEDFMVLHKGTIV